MAIIVYPPPADSTKLEKSVNTSKYYLATIFAVYKRIILIFAQK